MVLPSPGTLIAGKYQLESLLGEGGMGAVFRARHVLMDAPVAVKWLRPDHVGNEEARQRLLREARAIARVRHPNVVQVFDVDTHEGALFMVMELLEGQSLADLIAAETLSIRRVVQLLIGAMQGCAAAHEHGIIHRDIKPENIFVVKDRRHPQGLPKLLDFGISKVEARAQVESLTQSGLSVGTPLYMSVEQLTRTSEVDARTDIYSFGVVLYRALTGRPPFDGETFPAVVLSIALATPPPPRQLRPEISGSLEWVVMKAMARKREDRYANMDALIAALRAAEALSERPPAPAAASPIPSAQSQVRAAPASQVAPGNVRSTAAAQTRAAVPAPAADPISVIRPTEGVSSPGAPEGTAPPAKIAAQSSSPAAAAPRPAGSAPAADLASRVQPLTDAGDSGSERASASARPAAAMRSSVGDRLSGAERSSVVERPGAERRSVAERLRAAGHARAAAVPGRVASPASASVAPEFSNAARGAASAAASATPIFPVAVQTSSAPAERGASLDAHAAIQQDEGTTNRPVSPQRTPVPAVSTFASQETLDDNPFQRQPWATKQRLVVAAAVVIAGVGIALWGGMSDSLGGARAAPSLADPPATHLTQSAPSAPAGVPPETAAQTTSTSSSSLRERPAPVPFAPPVGFARRPSSLAVPAAPSGRVGGLVDGRSGDATPRAPDSKLTSPNSMAPLKRAPAAGFRPVPIISKSGGLRREDF